MKIKVCGMKYPDNIKELAKLPIDYMGLIFYEKSPRFVNELLPEELTALPDTLKRVGVFVNSPKEYILRQIERYKLDAVQLHGLESVVDCEDLKKNALVIKAFNISESSDFEKTKPYEGVCDYFLFDTKTPHHGGSGQKFDWSVLDSYTGQLPFFLSGGISDEDAMAVKKIKHPRLFAIDLNSRFELEPALKNIRLLDKFIKEIKR